MLQGQRRPHTPSELERNDLGEKQSANAEKRVTRQRHDALPKGCTRKNAAKEQAEKSSRPPKPEAELSGSGAGELLPKQAKHEEQRANTRWSEQAGALESCWGTYLAASIDDCCGLENRDERWDLHRNHNSRRVYCTSMEARGEESAEHSSRLSR